ncbi:MULTISPECIES: DUF5018-related domain-containing protein [Parabacteroides]|uniref:DUF5018-related domain-containing protein n=1 Tax=Parabacteroides TaxID=375288 RepID=UPI00240D69D7|nr:hypothetical protein [Parabacteroides chongii]WFE86891.1 hypothetical protein P3L47_10010 [Parabacteroides chongii]
MKLKNIVLALTLGLTSLSGCQSGIVWDEVPESAYSELGLGSGYMRNRPRELFKNKVWQINYGTSGQWLDYFLAKSYIPAFLGETEYTNVTEGNITILGKTLAPGEKTMVKNTLEIVDDSSAPEGKKYIIHLFSYDKVGYGTPNKGHAFIKSAFDSESVKPYAYIEKIESESAGAKEDMFRYVVMPVKQHEMVLEFIWANSYSCTVEPVNGAPQLGTPGDYTKPQQYLVKNIAIRPDGVPQAQRLYEVQVHLLEVTPEFAQANTSYTTW